MSFTAAASLCSQAPGLGVLGSTSAAPVSYRGKLYVFYMGSGNDGIFYTAMGSDDKWSGIACVNQTVQGINVAPATSPTAVVYNDKLHLFYAGAGNDGIWCTSYDGGHWSSIYPLSPAMGGMGFLPRTSPTATVYQNRLYLFWNGCRDDGIFYSSYDSAHWVPQARIGLDHGIAQNTSPSAITYKGSLYLFWNGVSNDGTWYSRLDGGGWLSQISVSSAVGGMGFLPGTSPGAVIMRDKFVRLFWVGSGGRHQGLWYSDYDGQHWTSQRCMASDFGHQDIGEGTSPTVTLYDKYSASQQSSSSQGGSTGRRAAGTAFVFWKSSTHDLHYSRGD